MMMNQVIHTRGVSTRRFALSSSEIPCRNFFIHPRNVAAFKKKKCRVALIPSIVSIQSEQVEDQSAREIGSRELYTFPNIQFLSNFPKSELLGKTVMVRMDAMIVLQGMRDRKLLPDNAIKTITYLHKAGAEVVLVGSWYENIGSGIHLESCPSTITVANFLSLVLGLEVVAEKYFRRSRFPNLENEGNPVVLLLENLYSIKGERANCSKFAKELASCVDMIINDAFSESHKVLASTVSGGNFAAKAAAVHTLISLCDGLVFLGTLAFQILHVLGIPVPLKLMNPRELEEASKIVEHVKSRNIPLILPKDFWCTNDHNPDEMELLSVYSILPGWQPVDVGPRALDEIISSLSKCKKALWLGPLSFNSSRKGRILELARALVMVTSCDTTFVGRMEFKEFVVKSTNLSNCDFLASATIVWEVLKGRTLPGLMALDKAYPFQIAWGGVYEDPMKPLVVDVGSGNGLFLFGMATRRIDMNFLGLEMNTRLVDRCQDDANKRGIHNVHFIATDATSTFRSIVSNYPGKLALVSMQCPNPDFKKSEYCHRMLRRSLVSATIDMLMTGGKVFLQSDIEGVAIRMKREFMEHGKGCIIILQNQGDMASDGQVWLKENPFGVPSDWERHVLLRGDPMYRLLLSKVEHRC